MALAETVLDNGFEAQTEASLGMVCEDLAVQDSQLSKDEDSNQDPCIEKLEVNDQEQKLASSVPTIDKPEKLSEEHEKSPLVNLETTQKSDAKGASNPLKNLGGRSSKAGIISLKKPSTEPSGALNGRSSQSSKGEALSGFLTRTNGASRIAEAAKLSEGLPSTTRLSLKQAHVRKSLSNFTVPQPFALATDKRASLGGQPHSSSRVYVSSRSFSSQVSHFY
ncbi:hypothetical protein L7F22_016446 [Adiantum nelumboides]|nr:hypothetical protein [Adiantum nelumboides]